MIPRRKYGNKKVVNSFGEFDSALEYKRFLILKDEEGRGVIRNLRRQVPYLLIPNQYATEIVHLKTKDKVVEKLAERKVEYVADFVYEKDGKDVVEDTKGLRLADYILKRKMMLYFHGIAIREVKKPTEPI